jgi:hypothetical protein
MTLNFRKFDEPKPSMFPLMQEVVPDRNWEIDPEKRFGKQLYNQLTDDRKQEVAQQKKAGFHSTLQLATLQTGTSHFGIETLAGIEQGQGRGNSELVNRSSYVNLNTVIDDSVLTQAVAANISQEVRAKKNKLDDDTIVDVDDVEEAENKDTLARGFTYVHNANIYKGAASLNPFKKGDSEHYKMFENNDYFKMLTQGFMSPLRALGQKAWDKASGIMNAIQSKAVKVEGVIDPFRGNKVEEFDIESNYNAILANEEYWKSWDKEDFYGFILRRWSDVKNYQKTMRSIVGSASTLTHEMSLISESEAVADDNYMQFADKAQKIEDLMKEVETKNLSADLDSVTQEEINAIKIQTQSLIDSLEESPLSDQEAAVLVKHKQEWEALAEAQGLDLNPAKNSSLVPDSVVDWWENQANIVPSVGMILPFGLMAETAEHTAKEMALGNWGGAHDSDLAAFINDEEGGFMDLAISGYLDYLAETELDGTKAAGRVTERMLGIDSIEYGRQVFNSLQKAGYLTAGGDITEKFKINSSPEDLEITVNDAEKERIHSILFKQMSSDVNFDKLDVGLINGFEKGNVKLTLPDGSAKSIEDVFGMIGTGDTAQDKYSTARDAYNVLFDMMTSMMDLSSEGESNGNLKLKKTDNGFQATVYPKGSWEEWDPELTTGLNEAGEEVPIGGWKTVSGEPVNITFETQEEAKAFFQKIRSTVANLEPIVATFEPVDNSGPGRTSLVYQDGNVVESALRVLVDNEGELGADGPISFGGAEHAYKIDNLYHHTFFKTEQWQASQKYIVQNTAYKLGHESFKKSQENRIFKMRHKKQKEDYKERKKEHEEKEYWRVRDEYKRLQKAKAKRRKIQKEYEKAVEARFKKQQQEAKAAQNKRNSQKASSKSKSK